MDSLGKPCEMEATRRVQKRTTVYRLTGSGTSSQIAFTPLPLRPLGIVAHTEIIVSRGDL